MHYSLQPSLKAGSGTRERPPQPDAAAVASLCKAADAIGTRMQYSHQGFLPNVRQQRAGGLAAIELAQTLRQLVKTFTMHSIPFGGGVLWSRTSPIPPGPLSLPFFLSRVMPRLLLKNVRCDFIQSSCLRIC